MLCHDRVLPQREAAVGGVNVAGLDVGPAGREPFAKSGSGKLGTVLGGAGNDLGVGAVSVG